MPRGIENTALPFLEPTSRPVPESVPAWTIRVARTAAQDRNELAQELHGVPKAALRQVFGKRLGTGLWHSNTAAKSSSETGRIPDAEISSGMLHYLCAEAATTLRERKRFAKSVSLTVQYPNGESETAHQLLLRSTNDRASLEDAAQAAIRGMRSNAFVSLKLDLTATATQA